MDNDKEMDLLLGKILAAQNQPLTPPTTKPSSPASVERGPVTVEGIAEDAFNGAVVVDDDDWPHYVVGLEEWHPDYLGKRVTVTGTSGRSELAPDPDSRPDGAIGHGSKGSSSVIFNATWKSVE